MQAKKHFKERAMREIRTFELEHGEPASAWRVAQPLAVNVLAGELWLTVEGDADDYWLAPGESFELKRGAVAWMSAGRDGVRLSLTVASGPSDTVRVERRRTPRFTWMPRWLLTA
jgi:quercetin dioxygenase-like cupin family protein